MDWRYIFYFKRVAELEHITKAAEELYISQAHLSRIIAEVEDYLGLPLFDREGKGIALNDCGRTFYEYVLQMIALIDTAKRQTREVYERGQAQVTMATNAGAYMPRFLVDISKQAPRLKVRQYSAPRKGLLSMLRNGQTDFAISSPPINEIGFSSTILYNETPVVIYPRGHWLEGYESVSLRQLKDEAFVGVAQGYGARDAVEDMYSSLGITPNFVIETGDTSSVVRYVYEGLGIALCAESLIKQNEYHKDHYVKIDEAIPCLLALSWRKDLVFNDIQQQFHDMAVSYFKNLGKL